MNALYLSVWLWVYPDQIRLDWSGCRLGEPWPCCSGGLCFRRMHHNKTLQAAALAVLVSPGDRGVWRALAAQADAEGYSEHASEFHWISCQVPLHVQLEET